MKDKARIVSSRNYLRYLIILPVLAFLLLFYFYPLIRISLLSLLPSQFGSSTSLLDLTQSTTWLNILWFTCWQAALSTLLTLLIALPAAFVFGGYSFPGKKLLEGLSTIPFVLPTVVTAAGFRALLGDGGLLNHWLVSLFHLSEPPIHLEQSLWFFLLAHIFYNYSLVLRIVSGFFASLPEELNSAARMLGASPFTCFFRITLPLLMPAIGSAALLTFIFCFTSFGVVLILGGPTFATLEVEIYRQSIQLFNLPMAACLSLVQIMVNFLLMWLHGTLSERYPVGFFGSDPTASNGAPKKRWEKVFTVSNLTIMVLLLVTPLAALILRSFYGSDGFTLDFYTALFSRTTRSVFYVEPISAVFNSLYFALATTCAALALGLCASVFLASSKSKKTAIWDSLIMLPLATSAVTLGFGYIISLNRAPLNLRDSVFLVIIAHTLVAFPFVVRCILPSLKTIPESTREAARLLGSSPFQVFRHIDLPLTARAVLVGAIFAFSISMGEFGASAFVTRPHTPTMPVAIFRLLGQPGEMNYGQAMAMSSILMFVTCSGFLLLGKLEKRWNTPRKLP